MSGKEENETTVQEMEAITLSDPPEFESVDLSADAKVVEKINILVSFWERVKNFVLEQRKNIFSDSGARKTRAYQVWPGNNVFFFRGRFICGPDPRGSLLTAVSIGLSYWIFSVYIAHDVPKHSSYMLIISSILTLIVLGNLLLVSTIDPGIIPRNEQHTVKKVGIGKSPTMTVINVNGIGVKSKYCRICKIFRPPRSCHCAICDNCVERFDHHCPWIGQCIGLRNYRFYVSFLVLGFIFFFYIFAYCFWRIHERVFKDGTGFLRLMRYSPETVALALFSFGAIWLMGCLASYHMYLIAINQTFYENFQKCYTVSPNPYDKGILGNIKEALFSPLPPSRVDFCAEITPNGLGSCHN